MTQTLREYAAAQLEEFSHEYGPRNDRDQAIVRWERHLISTGDIPDDILETMPEVSRHDEPQLSPQEYECGCVTVTRVTDRDSRVRGERPFEMRLAISCGSTACTLKLMDEQNAAHDLWTWLPSHRVAVKCHGDQAAEHRPSNCDVMKEAAMWLDCITRADPNPTAEERTWFEQCPCGEDHPPQEAGYPPIALLTENAHLRDVLRAARDYIACGGAREGTAAACDLQAAIHGCHELPP